MLGKLLKYDLKSSFKVWWILALAFFGMSILSGIGGFVYALDLKEAFGMNFQIPNMIKVMGYLAWVLYYALQGLFLVGSSIIIFIRFYRNFFTDEGYLTFTLPVKRTTLLNSKIINGMLVMGATELVSIVGASIWSIPHEISRRISGYYDETVTINPTYEAGWIDFLQIAILFMEMVALNFFIIYIHNLFIYWCGTFAATITKKARVVTSVGIYYVASNVVGFLLEIILCFGIASVGNWLADFSETGMVWMIILLLLCLILICWIISILLYVFEYWMLDKKLNMA